jgi:hypothetical protein
MLEKISRPMTAFRMPIALACLQLLCLGCGASVVLEDDGTGGGAPGGNGPTTGSSGVTASATSSSNTGLMYADDKTYAQLDCYSHDPRLFVVVNPSGYNGGCYLTNTPGTSISISIGPWDGLAGTYAIDDALVVATMPDSQKVTGGTLTVSVSQPWWPTEVVLDFDPPFDYASGTAKLAVCSETIGTNPCR